MPLMSWHAFPERPVLVSPRSTRDETGILRNEGVASSHMRIYDEGPEKFTAKLGTGAADKHVRQGFRDLGFIATTALKHLRMKGYAFCLFSGRMTSRPRAATSVASTPTIRMAPDLPRTGASAPRKWIRARMTILRVTPSRTTRSPTKKLQTASPRFRTKFIVEPPS